jgi:beta-N-acetylhexosaminidase
MKLTEKQKAILGVLSPGFGGTELPAYIKGYLKQGLGAITLFGSNTPDLETTAKLIKEIRAINPDCVISIDEESGDVTRIWAKSGSPFPAPYLLGKIDDEQLTETVFQQLGARLALADIDVTFGPVLDLVISEDNPIVGVRSFGSKFKAVSTHGAAAVRGLGSAGINASPKHFPGHGKTSADSHHDLPQIKASLAEMMKEDIAPFASSIAAGANAIMVGHLVVPSVDTEPASLSSIWCEDVLRRQLNFEGVIVTDALDMGALGGLDAIHFSALKAIRAGANLLCLSGIADQSNLLSSILELAESELKASDLKKIEISKQKLKKLRRNTKLEIGVHEIPTHEFHKGFESSGDLKIKSGSIAVLSLEATPTIASGHIAWGLESSFQAFGLETGEFDVAENKIVQFRDAWRDPVILDRLNMIKQTNPNAIYVDFGWPTRGFEAPNMIRAFGATRAHSDSVARLLLDNRQS